MNYKKWALIAASTCIAPCTISMPNKLDVLIELFASDTSFTKEVLTALVKNVTKHSDSIIKVAKSTLQKASSKLTAQERHDLNTFIHVIQAVAACDKYPAHEKSEQLMQVLKKYHNTLRDIACDPSTQQRWISLSKKVLDNDLDGTIAICVFEFLVAYLDLPIFNQDFSALRLKSLCEEALSVLKDSTLSPFFKEARLNGIAWKMKHLHV